MLFCFNLAVSMFKRVDTARLKYFYLLFWVSKMATCLDAEEKKLNTPNTTTCTSSTIGMRCIFLMCLVLIILNQIMFILLSFLNRAVPA